MREVGSKFMDALLADETGDIDRFLDSEREVVIHKEADDGVAYNINYNPITAQFHSAKAADLRGLFSPFGSGTSSAVVYELARVYPLFRVLPLVKPDARGEYNVFTRPGILSHSFVHLHRSFIQAATQLASPGESLHYHTQERTLRIKKRMRFKPPGKEKTVVVNINAELLMIALDRAGAEAAIPGLIIDVACLTEPAGLRHFSFAEKLRARAGRFGHGNFRNAKNPRATIVEGNPPAPSWPGWAWFGFPVSGRPRALSGATTKTTRRCGRRG